jgi:hypothetical protein
MPSRNVKLAVAGVLLLAGAVGVVSANDDSSGDDDATRVAIGTAVSEPSPAGADPPDVDPPAPAGSSPGVWWRPGADGLRPSQLWVFDPSTNSGYQKEYQPAGSAEPFQHQRAFTYDSTDSGVRVSFLSMTSDDPHDEDLTSLRYSSDGVLRVDRDGSTESWFGCSSSEMPEPATVLC